MAYSVYYLFMGFAADKHLPWSRCNDDSINTMNCYSLLDAEECGNSENNWQIYWNRTCTNIEDFCDYYEYDDYINNTFCVDSTIENPVPVPVQNLSFRVSSAE